MTDGIRKITDTDLGKLIKAMRDNGVDYAIFGAAALMLHGIVRPTEDIDVFIDNQKENVQAFIRAMKDTGLFDNITEEELQDLIDEDAFEYGVIKFGGDIGLDVATTMGERSLKTLDWEVKEYNGINARVVTLKQLFEMKSSSMRQKDKDDAESIAERGGIN